MKTTPSVMYSSQVSTQSTQSSADTTSASEMDMCFDDDIETAMLEQCMEESNDWRKNYISDFYYMWYVIYILFKINVIYFKWFMEVH